MDNKLFYFDDNWVNLKADSKKMRYFVITVVVFAISMFTFTRFLNFIEARPGVVLPDPILALFTPIDLSWFTFVVMYGTVVLVIMSLFKTPMQLAFAIQTYIAMLWIRILAMYSIPLEAPATILPLIDPMVSEFGVGQLMTKDLFFSGHTATIFLMYLASQKKIYKNLFLLATIIIGLAVTIQHVHYSVDVIAAPFFAYTCYRAMFLINKKFIVGKFG